MAPKIGHPLQKVLGANRAHVFDLTDSSLSAPSTWSIPPRQRPGLSQRPGRARRIQPGIGSGQRVRLRPCRRALALLCRPTGKAAFRRGALGGDPAQEWLPLSIPLNTDIRQVGDVKGHLNLPAQPGLPRSGTRRITRLAGDFHATELGARGMVRPTARWSLPGGRSNWRRNCARHSATVWMNCC